MKTIIRLASAIAVGLLAVGSAYATGEFNPPNEVPEPGSIALVGAAVAAVIAFSRKGK